jgi:Ca2+-binding EF-hand superfamily protein
MKGVEMKKIILFVVLSFVFANHVYAASNAFNDLDTDRNGKIDMKELDTAADNIFKQYDKNGDNFLDISEFKAIKNAKSRFEDLDSNKDGKLDIKELRDAAAKKFKSYDKNLDGALDQLECNPRKLPDINPLFIIYF